MKNRSKITKQNSNSTSSIIIPQAPLKIGVGSERVIAEGQIEGANFGK